MRSGECAVLDQRLLAGARPDRGLAERDQHRAERGCRRIGPLPLEDRKLQIRQKGQAGLRAENAKSAADHTGRKRRDRKTRQRRSADTGQTGARVDDLPVVAAR